MPDTTTLTQILEEERDALSEDIYGLFQIVDCMTHALAEEDAVDWLSELAGEIPQIRYKIQGVLDQFWTAEEEDRIRTGRR